MTDVEAVTDYGLGTFKGKPIVLVNQGITVYHRHNHNGRVGTVTFTEDFARNDCGARPCKVCFNP